MSFNGNGTFNPLPAPDFPAVAGEIIYASRFNSNLQDIFNGLSNCLTRDGQSPAGANLPMNGFVFTGLGAGTTTGQSLSWGQVGASLRGLTVTDTLVVSAPVITLSTAWDFTQAGASLRVTTQPLSSGGTLAASGAYVDAAVLNAISTIAPNMTQAIQALAILNYIGA